MKIFELDIENVRGIPNLSLRPGGKNLVVWGLNGSGKSAVVDAIDFLLTGHISRLIGEGTGDISLAKHGHHILHKQEEAMVRALIKLDLVKEPIEIKRHMDKPTDVEINCEKDSKEFVEFVLWNAQRGQHVLARREILKYIHSEAGNRAKRIQELLNLSDIESIRGALVSVKHRAEEENRTSQHGVKVAEAAINQTVGEKSFSQQSILDYSNKNRKTLGGNALTKVTTINIQKDIRKPADSSNVIGMNSAQFDRVLENVNSEISPEQKEKRAIIDKKLRKIIQEIRSDKDSLKKSARLQLTQAGIRLIDTDGSCPLCDTPWKPGELLNYLKEKIKKGKQIAENNEAINEMCNELSSHFEQLSSSLKTLIQATAKIELVQEKALLVEWLKQLEGLSVLINNPIEKYPIQEEEIDIITNLKASKKIDQVLVNIKKVVKERVPDLTPELSAWTSLVQLTENLKALETAKVKLEQSNKYLKRATILHDSFHTARDKIMGVLYDTVRDRFVELYRQLHNEDESKFTAVLKPVGPALDFEVDFYNCGSHPPHALHSEGHQDSMGICLYLALAENLNKGLINLIILDDVVMSVDNEHRKKLCSLLSTSFPEKQFIITTHDRTWANQLKAEGLVKSNELIEFNNWNIDTGPQVSYDVILWDKIAECLGKGDVPNAAFYLRRGLESFFCETCDSLEASIKYNIQQKWELGDWCPAVLKQYRNLVKQGKNAANSWSDEEALKKLDEREKISAAIFETSQAEQWNINEEVHYNSWKDSQKEDFYPVVEAFKDLCSLFECSKCGCKLKVVSADKEKTNVRCSCGNENWNLTEKRKN
ncbi:MAG: AAA family ATPase [Dehalococcoidales bacterium]|nr:AAA family ATPase [Dehalococcoidales bacterium]